MVYESIRGLIFTSKQLAKQEATAIKALMQSDVMREVLVEALDIGTQMREVKSIECFETLADITRFVLTLLEHEEITENRTLYTILTTACHLYVIQTKRKTYLCTLLHDHSIWSMNAPWNSCIKYELDLKMD